MALMLSRRLEETVILTLPNGETIRVAVARITPGQVRLAIEAPWDVLILREELEAMPCATN